MKAFFILLVMSWICLLFCAFILVCFFKLRHPEVRNVYPAALSKLLILLLIIAYYYSRSIKVLIVVIIIFVIVYA